MLTILMPGQGIFSFSHFTILPSTPHLIAKVKSEHVFYISVFCMFILSVCVGLRSGRATLLCLYRGCTDRKFTNARKLWKIFRQAEIKNEKKT
jgi:hypothetical protein